MMSNWRNVKRSAVMAAVLCLGVQFAVATSATDEGDSWRGAGVLKGGKGYAPTPLGQVHYRDVGPRDAKIPLLLLHTNPLWLMEFAEVQRELAALGLRSIAVDTPGCGLSDPPPKQPTIPEFADALVAVLDHLKLAKVLVAGTHTGAGIGASLAANHPDRVAAVILHGVPAFNAEEIKVRLDRPPTDRTPREDGSHLSRSFRPAASAKRPPDPEALKHRTWQVIATFLQGPDFSHYALFRHDVAADVKRIKARGMIMSDVGDAIHPVDLRVAKLRPDFAYKEFGGAETVQTEPEAWAKAVAEFVRQVVK